MNKRIKKIIRKTAGDLYKDIEIPDFSVEYPRQREFGDYASNIAMVLGRVLSRNPMDIAVEIRNRISAEKEGKELFSKVVAAKPGFVNFVVSDEYLRNNLAQILKRKDRFGSSNVGKGQTVVIDYSAPNVAKPMHVGHLRSTVIGQALYNIYKFLGYRVIGDNHIGDWGTQFGKLIYAYKYWGDRKKIKCDPIAEMARLYVKFHKEAETNKELEELARRETKKLQEKDRENIKIWKFLVRESLKEFNKIYKTLNVKFDYVLGESFYDDMLEDVVRECLQRKIASQSEGAIVINLERYNLPPFLIRKKDGAYLYATTDLATVKYRKEKFNPDKILYVVSNEQTLHFQQLFASLELLGWNNHIEFQHVKFGMVLGEDGKKFSTRRGELVPLEKIIKKSIEMARKVVEGKNPSLSNKEKKRIARVVGIGAIKYNDLSQNRLTDITFDWDKMLSFDGNSAPYLQYTYARVSSLSENFYKLYRLERFNPFDKPDFSLLKEKEEKDIARELIKFPEVVERAAEENFPHLIALYLYELASLYNNFYNSFPVLKSEKRLAKARVYLSKAVSIVIKNGLGLLGIDVLERI